MLHTLVDVSQEKVVDLAPSGDPHGYVQELRDLYKRLTGQDANYDSLEQLKIACLEAVHNRFFSKIVERPRTAREYDTRPVVPPWINPETGQPTREPDPNVASAYTRTYHKEGPVSKAREIFEKMWGSPRKDIIEACAKAGIKRSTAATQYQHFKKAKEGTMEHRNPSNGMPQLAPGIQATPPEPAHK